MEGGPLDAGGRKVLSLASDPQDTRPGRPSPIGEKPGRPCSGQVTSLTSGHHLRDIFQPTPEFYMDVAYRSFIFHGK